MFSIDDRYSVNKRILQLAAILDAARQSDRTFRGLTGADRHALYLCAMGTGFRASELASLTPRSLRSAAPIRA